MKKIFFIFFTIHSTFLYSQNTSEKKLGSWYMYHGNHNISKKLFLQSGFQLRTYEVIKNNNLSFGYLGAGFKTKSNFIFTAKYGYIEIDRSIEFNEQPNAIEHRIMADVVYSFRLKSHKILQRVRTEHRFIHFMNSNIYQLRFRYLIGYGYPVFKNISLQISNEFFFKTEGESYTENRMYAGFNVKTYQKLSFIVGYMKQFINNQHLDRLQFGILINTGIR